MYIKTQTFLVLGVSKSGFSAAKYILEKGGECYVYEELKSPKIDRAVSDICSLGAKRVEKDKVDQVLSITDVLLLSPGAPINHELAVKAKEQGVRIIGELEFGFLQFNPPCVAITGTNGKTTTATLIDAIMKEDRQKSQLVGNVGVPITSKITSVDTDTVLIAEVSSFQLESVNAFCPHISCVLNLAPDHLERHYTMDNYVFLKKRIFKNQRESEYAVLNYDDEIVRGFYPEVKSKVVWISLKECVDGAYISDGKIYFDGEYLMDEKDLRLKGEHNAYNALFAIVATKLIGVSDLAIVTALKNFKGVRHRIEHVLSKNGVDYYNDSKATNTASTISALSSMVRPTVLILGGSEKGENYVNLFDKIKKSPIKQVILTGASRFNMLETAGRVGYSNVTVTANFYDAVKIANMFTESGDNLLLSPACASYDCFDGYEERGDAFVKIVEGL